MYDKHALAEELRVCEQQSRLLWTQAQSLRAQAESARKHFELLQSVERILTAMETLTKTQQADAILELRRMAMHKADPSPKKGHFPERRGNPLYTMCNYPTLYVLDWPMRECGPHGDRGYQINEAGMALLAYIDRQSTLSGVRQ